MVLAEGVSAGPTAMPGRTKNTKGMGPSSTFGTQSATAKRGAHFCKNPLLKIPVSLFLRKITSAAVKGRNVSNQILAPVLDIISRRNSLAFAWKCSLPVLREAPVRFGSVTIWGWNGSSGSSFRFRFGSSAKGAFLCFSTV